jgi:hypothetical protein
LAEVGLITVLPDDNELFLALQVVTGVAAGAGALTLLAVGSVFSVLQSTD